VENVADIGMITNSYKILVRTPEGRDIGGKMNLKEIAWEGLDGIHLPQDPVAGFCEHGNELLGYIKGNP
jgi:hypothetical protein